MKLSHSLALTLPLASGWAVLPCGVERLPGAVRTDVTASVRSAISASSCANRSAVAMVDVSALTGGAGSAVTGSSGSAVGEAAVSTAASRRASNEPFGTFSTDEFRRADRAPS